MSTPSQILLASNVMKSIRLENNSQLISTFKQQQLVELKNTAVTTLLPQSKFRPVILNLINKYQRARIYELDRLKIEVLLQGRGDAGQLPKAPSSLGDLPNYTFHLLSLSKYELSLNNQLKKQAVIDSIDMKFDELKKIDNTNNDLIKSLITESILQNKFNKDSFKMLDFDLDVFYIICLKYFVNPQGLGRASRIGDLFQSLNNYGNNLRIDIESWKFLKRLVDQNLLSIKAVNEQESLILDKLIEIVEGVDMQYQKFNLLGMLRILRNAETGFERVETQDIIKFRIGYYRYLIIERALNEWNREALTPSVWEQYKFDEQWKTIWEIYYQNENIKPPGGPTTMKHVSKLLRRQV